MREILWGSALEFRLAVRIVDGLLSVHFSSNNSQHDS